MNDTQAHWEEHYGERERVWSGRVNVRLAEVAAELPAGRALDLGCGEGADAVWLAERGWDVVAVDISETALGRAAEAASARGVADRIEFVQHDLSDSFPDGTFDLVSAQFLHSTVRLDRSRILAKAADAVRPNGLLLIVDHGSAPPWASKLDHVHEFPSAEEVVAGMDLSADEFDRLRVEAVERDAGSREDPVDGQRHRFASTGDVLHTTQATSTSCSSASVAGMVVRHQIKHLADVASSEVMVLDVQDTRAEMARYALTKRRSAFRSRATSLGGWVAQGRRRLVSLPLLVLLGHASGARPVTCRDGGGFVGEEHPVFDVAAPGDRAQCRRAVQPPVDPHPAVSTDRAADLQAAS